MSATTTRAILAIALNELRRVATDRVALFFSLALPVIITVIIGSTFGAAESLEVGVLDRDGTDGSAALIETVDRAEGVTVERYGSLDTLRRDVRTGSIEAGVVIPAGYGRDVDRGTGAAAVDLVSDPTSSSVAAVRATVEGAVADEAVRVVAARFAADQGTGDLTQARATADRLAGELPAARVRMVAADSEAEGDIRSAGESQFSYTAPSNLVLFVFINTIVVGSLLANDRKRGIVQRLLATPHGTGTILAGIGASKLLFAAVQSVLLTTIGALLFGLSWGDPLGAALLIAVFALVATATGLLVGTVVSDADQAQAIAIPVAIGMGMLGGCMWPLDIVPSAMRVAGHAVPHAWAMDAWVKLIFDGEGVGGIAPELAALSVFAVVLGVSATRRLRTVLTDY